MTDWFLLRTYSDQDPTATDDGFRRFCSDILLHEMVQQAVWEDQGIFRDEEHNDHGPEFLAEWNRVGEIVGLAECDLPRVPNRPRTVRPSGYCEQG